MGIFIFLIFVSIIESFKPHIRKNINLDPYEYLFVYEGIFFIGTFLLLCRKTDRSLNKIFNDISIRNYIIIIVSALITVQYVGHYYKIEKNLNTSYLNTISRNLTLVLTFIIGILFFNEKIEKNKIAGILCILLGIGIMSHE